MKIREMIGAHEPDAAPCDGMRTAAGLSLLSLPPADSPGFARLLIEETGEDPGRIGDIVFHMQQLNAALTFCKAGQPGLQLLRIDPDQLSKEQAAHGSLANAVLLSPDICWYLTAEMGVLAAAPLAASVGLAALDSTGGDRDRAQLLLQELSCAPSLDELIRVLERWFS